MTYLIVDYQNSNTKEIESLGNQRKVIYNNRYL